MKLALTLTTNPAQRARMRGIVGLAQRAMAATVEELETYVESQVAEHNRTGALFASITKKREGTGWFLGHDGQRAPHALFVHWGTRRHVIKPKSKKVLRWAAGNSFAFARKVDHPGYKGDPWLVRAAAQAPAVFSKHVDRLLASSGAPQEA